MGVLRAVPCRWRAWQLNVPFRAIRPHYGGFACRAVPLACWAVKRAISCHPASLWGFCVPCRATGVLGGETCHFVPSGLIMGVLRAVPCHWRAGRLNVPFRAIRPHYGGFACRAVPLACWAVKRAISCHPASLWGFCVPCRAIGVLGG